MVQVGDTFYWMVDSTIDFSIGSTPAPTDAERKVAEAKGILILGILRLLYFSIYNGITTVVFRFKSKRVKKFFIKPSWCEL